MFSVIPAIKSKQAAFIFFKLSIEKIETMNLILVILSLFAATCYAANGQGKLQIGIKKRVEDCTMKTRKNDLVHIHYTVRQIDNDG